MADIRKENGSEIRSGSSQKEGKARSNQKLKIMYLMKILMEKTDETHSITLGEIVEELKRYDVTAERKSLYSDIELKLLVDSVQSAKFITEKKSRELIHKIESCASEYEGKQLQRQVFVSGRVKTMNERIY